LFNDLDSLPTPSFDDYFATLAASPLRSRVRPGLPLETSRGCWWGAVHQCTFCGLNGTSLGYRAKSPGRVLAELDDLAGRYQLSDFEAVDNILDMGYYKSLLPALAQDGRQRRIFYEIKANLNRAQVQALVRAGVTWVQPGIESLHSDVLTLMDKGISGWQNVQLLKWAREFGLRLSWSILWGFPGEKDDWYQDMASWLPALEHLQPPASTPRIRYDRYSVYHEQARRLGLILFPVGAMSLIYPVGPAELDNLAYFFATEPSAGPLRYIESLKEEISNSPGITALVKAALIGGPPTARENGLCSRWTIAVTNSLLPTHGAARGPAGTCSPGWPGPSTWPAKRPRAGPGSPMSLTVTSASRPATTSSRRSSARCSATGWCSR
jgi:ribosomal peptide maturation radical SAM protein 1